MRTETPTISKNDMAISAIENETPIMVTVRDVTVTDAPFKSYQLPPSSTCEALYEKIAQDFGYINGSFKLVYDQSGHEIEVAALERRLSEVCISGQANRFQLTEIQDGVPPKPALETPNIDKGAGTVTFNDMPTYSNNEYYSNDITTESTYSNSVIPYNNSGTSWNNPPSYNSVYNTPSTSGYSSSGSITVTKYRGLVNQAMTCYLNSLLQSLYMTPEFRNALYEWSYVPEQSAKSNDAERCIPYQLQHLFLEMQTSKLRSIETTQVTKSFGWDSSDAWQQHDVQELCRVMFDALEQKWKDTDQANLLKELYEGQYKDYVRCLQCKTESARTTAFMDIPLVIRPFGSQTTYTSVEESLAAFIKPEVLSGDNQYQCETCQCKTDAIKGLRFTSFPYLLTLQLRRFDFDYKTFNRIKLNDRMSFPYLLDLNDKLSNFEDQLPSTPVDFHASNSQFPSEFSSSVDDSCQPQSEVEETYSGFLSDEDKRDIIKHRGEYVYELFSVMIHSGSAAGGHYYAYIKCMEDGNWYSYNDQSVSTVTLESITRTYGGSLTGSSISSTFTSSTNAYMLMYRKIDPHRNKKSFSEQEFPEHLMSLQQRMVDLAAEERAAKEQEKNLYKLKTFVYTPENEKPTEQTICYPKHNTLSEAAVLALQSFKLDDKYSVENVRIVKYNSATDGISNSFHRIRGDTELYKILGEPKTSMYQSYLYDLLLEIKQPEETWQNYEQGGRHVQLYTVNTENSLISPPTQVFLNSMVKPEETKRLLKRKLSLAESLYIRLLYYSDGELKELYDDAVEPVRIYSASSKMYVVIGCVADEFEDLRDSALYRLVDGQIHSVKVTVLIPSRYEIDKYRTREKRRADYICQASVNEMDTDPDAEPMSFTGPISLPPQASLNNDSLDEVDKTAAKLTTTAAGENNTIKSSTENQLSTATVGGELAVMSGSATSELSQEKFNNSPINPSDPPPDYDSACKLEQPEENWDEQESLLTPLSLSLSELEKTTIFTENAELTTKRSLGYDVTIDKRTTIFMLKKLLDKKVDMENLETKLYKIYSNNQEFEFYGDLSGSVGDLSDVKVNLKLGRERQTGEFLIKVYEFSIKTPNTLESAHLVDITVRDGQTVAEVKKLISLELLDDDVEFPLNCMRLRKKNHRSPGYILDDMSKFGDQITVYNNMELLVQRLDGNDEIKGDDEICVFIQRWNRSKHELTDLLEIILRREATVLDLIGKISLLSGIDENDIELVKSRGYFPGETPLLEIDETMEWFSDSHDNLMGFPHYTGEAGALFYYRSKSEPPEKLTPERRKQIELADPNSHSRYVGNKYNRKEKALRIFTNDSDRD